MNFVRTPMVRALEVRYSISCSIAFSSPDFSAAMLMTKSISSAPRAALARISASLISVNVTPNGNAITVAIFTRESLRRSRAIGIYEGKMHTAAIPYSMASVQSRRMSFVVPIGRSNVWSIYRPKSDFIILWLRPVGLAFAPLIQYSNVGKIPQALRVVETEADDELIRNLE